MFVDYIFDTICPWCYLGKVRLERALAERPQARVTVRWRPFMLDPEMPIGGMDRRAYLERKFGGPARVQRLNSAVVQAARSEGVTFHFDRITRTPNTLHSHRLIRFSTRYDRQAQAVEALFGAYFRHGRDIGAIEELIALGADLGLPEAELADYLYSEADVACVMNDNARAHRLGVNGVPCIILDNRFAVSGAQDLDVLLRMLDLAQENQLEPVSG